jgi:hypothetical protein
MEAKKACPNLQDSGGIMNKKLDFSQRNLAVVVYPSNGGTMNLAATLAVCDARGGNQNPMQGSFVTDWRRLLDACHQAEMFEQTPIVGVCGTVNSGKSTVVRGFLSEKARPRVLVGQLAKEGTHRFVFWLPESWRGNGLGRLVEEMIVKQTGKMPEMLSDDPRIAADQYNAAVDRIQKFNIPLVAYDPALDSGGIAFLDCPDIQRSLDDSINESTAHLRLERLGTIAPLCSAFVLVSSMQQLGAEDVGKVFQALNHAASRAPLYFVLNMTDGDNVETYLPEAQKVIERWKQTKAVKRIYLSPFVHREDPSIPVRPVITSMDGERVALGDLAGELDPAELQKSHYASCVASLKNLIQEVRKQVTETSKGKTEQTKAAGKRICEFLSGKFVDGEGKLKALSYDEAAKRLAESIQRTAPLAIRLAQAPGNWFKGLRSKPKQRDANNADVDRYTQVKLSEFAVFLEGSRFMPPEVESKALERVWQSAAEAVKNHAGEAFADAKELDAKTQAMWDELSFTKKYALFSNILIAMGGFAIAGALLPFDGGASLVIWTKYKVVLGGSEILGILVGGPLLGTIMSTSGAKALVEGFEREVARPQLDVLYAALCDGLGIPRYLDGAPTLISSGRDAHAFKEVALPIQKNEVNLLQGELIRLDETAWDQMVSELEQKEDV